MTEPTHKYPWGTLPAPCLRMAVALHHSGNLHWKNSVNFDIYWSLVGIDSDNASKKVDLQEISLSKLPTEI